MGHRVFILYVIGTVPCFIIIKSININNFNIDKFAHDDILIEV